ncbi:ATP-binding protein [Pontibacter pamirensis]|uniref:ATP-binding protein n=1 Tax=Pontibacter pamirensis TaxID=2562824 RepID=UPI001F1CC4BD|nr:ATP-binding protein [Pontibacter pamirensis]
MDSALWRQPLVLHVQQTGASEIYLNGRLIKQLGVVSQNPEEVQARTLPQGHMIHLPLAGGTKQVLAVRYALQKDLPIFNVGNRSNFTLQIRLNEMNAAAVYSAAEYASPFEFFRAGFFCILAILHLAFFFFYPTQRANLYFFLYALFSALAAILINSAYKVHSVEAKMYLLIMGGCFIGSLNYFFYLRALYRLFNQPKGIVFWALTVGLFLFFLDGFWLNPYRWLVFILIVLIIPLETLRVALLGIKRKQRGAWIVAGGAISYFIFYSLFEAMAMGYLPAGPNWVIGNLMWNISYLSFPVSISILLALEFAFTSRTLEAKLEEVQHLSEKTLAQEQEKQQLLAAQNETLERQVVERTAEVVKQKEKLQATLEHLKATQNQLVHKEKMASLGELTAGIAHEIQNPLNFINNFSELGQELCQEVQEEVRQLSVPPGEKKNLQELISNLSQNQRKVHLHGQRADAIVKGMLEHSRSSAGEKQLTNINALVNEYLRFSYSGIRAKHKGFSCTLETAYDQRLEKIEVVPQELGRALLNLFNNAFYAVQQKQKLGQVGYEPKVAISTATQNGKAEIRVWDNGTGIPESVKHKIFQPFFTTKPTGQGTGLGLSLGYDIITKMHGGELAVATEQGEWAEFTITLPYVPVPSKPTLHTAPH